MSPELAGLAEIAAMLSVSRPTAERYAARADFPEPVERLAGGRIWRRVDVQAWASAHLTSGGHLPRPGRPPKQQ